MARYPRTVRDAVFKCIPCNAPITRTIDNRYVCVDCGQSPLSHSLSSNKKDKSIINK
jgi:DNA-directed RNA polymerase subunit RPC12/RpoP